VATAGS